MDSVKMLVEAGAYLNAVDNTGRTVLHHFATLGIGNADSVTHILDFLIRQGADQNMRSKDGKTIADLLGNSE